MTYRGIQITARKGDLWGWEDPDTSLTVLAGSEAEARAQIEARVERVRVEARRA